MRDEIRAIRFNIDPKGWSNLAIDRETVHAWTAPERALIDCLPDLLSQGVFLEELLELVAAMDQKIAEETARLREGASNAKIALRSPLFAMSYVLQHPDAPAISKVCSRLHGGLFKRASSAALTEHMTVAMTRAAVSAGQLNVLVALSRSIARGSIAVASFLRWAIEHFWLQSSYHLRLALADAAGCCWEVPDPQRSALIAALESRFDNNEPFVNTTIFESLQSLGASEPMETEHVGTVRSQLERLLTGNDDGEAWREAYNLYVCQFDHPYSSAYCEAINALSQVQRNTLLLMAGRGAQDISIFLPILLARVADIGGPIACEMLRRWTQPPAIDAFSPQDAIEAFVVAHTSLGRLQGDLPESPAAVSGSAEAALRACGVALYWANRCDLLATERCAACASAWEELKQYEKGTALDAIRNCTDLHMTTRKEPGTSGAAETIPHFFPLETADVCRHALERPEQQVGHFWYYSDFDRYYALAFAVDVLRRYGNTADLALLRGISNDSRLGHVAMKAVESLEARIASE
jgi:hypothetical protein